MLSDEGLKRLSAFVRNPESYPVTSLNSVGDDLWELINQHDEMVGLLLDLVMIAIHDGIKIGAARHRAREFLQARGLLKEAAA